MTIIIGYQFENSCVLGTDLLCNTTENGKTIKKELKEKLRKSKNGSHYIAYSCEGVSSDFLSELEQLSLEKLLTRDLIYKGYLTITLVDVKNAQIYLDPCLDKSFKTIFRRLRGYHTKRSLYPLYVNGMCITGYKSKEWFDELHEGPPIVISGLENLAEFIESYILGLGEKEDSIKGCATYIVKPDNIQLYRKVTNANNFIPQHFFKG